MADPLKTNFIVAPITTALQRLARNDARAFVAVAMADEEFVDFAARTTIRSSSRWQYSSRQGADAA